jgi:hypothetical protein
MPLLYILLGATLVTVPYLVLSSVVSLNTVGLMLLGMGLGVFLLLVVFAALWNNT